MDEKKIIENYKKRIQKQNDRIRESYDRISVTLPKGTKDRIQAQGLTINGFVNQLVLEKLDELDIAQARELLMTIKGVGEKVANCVLLFGLGRREAGFCNRLFIFI